jgi:hypothetical protein
MDRHLFTLARWLAKKAVKSELQAMGHKPEFSELAAAANAYLVLHRNALLKEAWEHPVARMYRHQERMRLARRAVIAQIRENGRRVNSIAPSGL